MSVDIIRSRRSVRQFTNKTVDPELIRLIIDAAMCAPSAGNQRPWDFLVVTDPSLIEQMSRTGPNSKPAAQAPLVILITGDQSRERYKGYWPIDCAAATQNMLLEATRHGLGAVWLGVHPVEERQDYLKQLFQLPLHIQPFAMICIGHPDADVTQERPSRYDERLVHFNKWS